MWLLILEAFLAVALLAGIVWWTMGPVRKRESKPDERGDAAEDGNELRAGEEDASEK